MLAKPNEVTIYTDGACLPTNPGPGGYAALLITGNSRREITGGYRLTTNNRMEINAAIVGLESLETTSRVAVYTDSKYLADSMMLGWAKSWRSKGWRKKDGKRINWDLWDRLLVLCDQHEVKFHWIRGHNGDVNNERCDLLSVEATKLAGLPPDIGYEKEQSSQIELFRG